MTPPILWLDFDDVIGNLLAAWVGRYNELSGDTLTEDDIVSWDTGTYCTRISRNKLYRILDEPDLYDRVEPMPNVQSGIAALDAMGVRWRIATFTCSAAMAVGKVNWLKRHNLGREYKGQWPGNLVCISDKSVLRGWGILDDGAHNLESFDGFRYLFDRPHNKEANVPHAVRVYGWRDFVCLLENTQPWRSDA